VEDLALFLILFFAVWYIEALEKSRSEPRELVLEFIEDVWTYFRWFCYAFAILGTLALLVGGYILFF